MCAQPGSEVFFLQKLELAAKQPPLWHLPLVKHCPRCHTPWGFLRAERKEVRVYFPPPRAEKMAASEKLLNRRSIAGEGGEEACAAGGRLGLRLFWIS